MTKTIKTQIQFIYEWKQRDEIYVESIAVVSGLPVTKLREITKI